MLTKLIKKGGLIDLATAIPAIGAIDNQQYNPKIATIAIADIQKAKFGYLGSVAPIKPDNKTRIKIIELMTEWNERAAMMTCSTCTAEQAELAAWHDLGLDSVFWSARVLH